MLSPWCAVVLTLVYHQGVLVAGQNSVSDELQKNQKSFWDKPDSYNPLLVANGQLGPVGRAPTSAFSKVNCDLDKYYWGSYQSKHFCVECPEGFVSDGCKQCAPDPQHHSCVRLDRTCEAGKFFSAATMNCAQCAQGKFQNQKGERSCRYCVPGQFNPPGSSSAVTCKACPIGKYSDRVYYPLSECKSCTGTAKVGAYFPCAKGKFGTTLEVGMDSRQKCVCQDCTAGKSSWEGQKTCQDCDPGRFSEGVGSVCVECAMGKFQPAHGAQECLSCPQDYYSEEVGLANCTLEPAKTIIFRSYGYKHQAVLASKGWKLMTANEFPEYESLLLKDYRRRDGLQVLVGFSSSSCCLSVENGMRVTAISSVGGKSKVGFVYPFDSTGIMMRCDNSEFNQYDASEKLKLRYHTGTEYQDISSAKNLGLLDVSSSQYAGAGLCGHKDDENNPGIYVGMLSTVADRSECEVIKGQTYCLEPPAKTRSPTLEPTNSPTLAPTEHPTHTPAKQDCKVTSWSFWSGCSVTCGLGNQTRTRSIHIVNEHGGKECPPLFDSRSCEMQGCENDCTMTTWTAWSSCSHTCGGGASRRNRSMIEPAQFGGRCYSTDAVEVCNTFPCPVHCEWSKYSTWGPCSASCGLGKQMRHRDIGVIQKHDGDSCDGSPTEYQDCLLMTCPTDCEVGSWVAWSSCSTSCGFGTHYRVRNTTKPATFGGRACAARSQKRFCHNGHCPVDCKVGIWGDWSGCSTTCGAGKQTRTRAIVKNTTRGGAACPSLASAIDCEIIGCPENCEVTQWSMWAECSHTCGQGSQLRERKITKQPGFGGEPCPTVDDDRLCNLAPCPVHCAHEEWGDWSACSTSCGIGTQTRSRTIKNQEEYGGEKCAGPADDSQSCKLEDCTLDCSVGEWIVTSACTQTCGSGWTTKVRHVTRPSKAGGSPCPHLQEQHACNTHSCPVDCVSAWGNWTACSVSCGAGTKTRTQVISVQPVNGGIACPIQPAETMPCMPNAHCPVDCEVNSWTAFGACPATCEAGRKSRTRQVTHSSAWGGQACPPLTHTVTCLVMKRCPVACAVATWSSWPKDCPGTCGTHLIFRRRKVLRANRYGGEICPLMVHAKLCRHENAHFCPTDCEIGAWADWGSCSKSCGHGSLHRKRTVVQASFGGNACPETVAGFQQKMCNEFPCATDCVLMTWTPWTQCTHSCGGGTTGRSRKLVKPAEHGGSCRLHNATKACNLQHCPTDCVTAAWGDWGECSATCGNSLRTRTRLVFSNATYGGKCERQQHEECTKKECPPPPIECTITTWSEWGECSKTCSIGLKARKRSLLTHEGQAPLYRNFNDWADTSQGGARCPPLEQVQECHGTHAHTPQCGHMCKMSPWEPWSTCTKSCGEGTQLKFREILSNPENVHCPIRQVTRKCNLQVCGHPNEPIDCQMTPWDSWSNCTLMLDGACKRKRTRGVLLEPRNKGALCAASAGFELCTGDSTKQCENSSPNPTKYACSHVTCKYVKNSAGIGRVVVLHHNHEKQGSGHLCTTNEGGHGCSCMCSDDLAETKGRDPCSNYLMGFTHTDTGHATCNNVFLSHMGSQEHHPHGTGMGMGGGGGVGLTQQQLVRN